MADSQNVSEAGTRRRRLPAVPALAVGLGLVLILYPFVLQNPYFRYVGVLTVMYMGLATSWNVMGGFTGYVSLGHSAFFGVGAYTTGLLVTRLALPNALSTVITGVVMLAVCAGIGYVAIRVRGASFVIVTIALVYITSLLAQGWRGLTGGSSGLDVPPGIELGRSQLHVIYYYAFLVLLLAVLATWWAIDRSKFGMGLKAIREDEDKAESLGVSTTAFKVIAFAISGAFTAMGGGLYASWFGFLDPIFVFSVQVSASIVLMALLGGNRYLLGPVLGALLIVPIEQYFLVQFGGTQVHLVAIGVVLGAVVLLMPDGITAAVAERWRRRQPPAASIREKPPEAVSTGQATEASS